MGPGAGARPGRASRAARSHARTHTHIHTHTRAHRNECTSTGANGWGIWGVGGMGGGSRRTFGSDRLSSQRRRLGGRGVCRSRTPGVVGRGIWTDRDGDGEGNVESSGASSWARLFWPRGQRADRGWVAARRARGERREARAEARPGVRVCVRTELERRPLNCGHLRKMGEAQSDMPLSASS